MKSCVSVLILCLLGGLAQHASPLEHLLVVDLGKGTASGSRDAKSNNAITVPKQAEPAEAAASAEATPSLPEPANRVSSEPEASLTVQVETLQTDDVAIDPASIRLLAPFPAKVLAAIPPGWRLDASAVGAPSFIRKVELVKATSITLNIRPHVLVPDTSAFALGEPGFDPALGYSQTQTVCAILANSIQQLDEDSKQLGNTIELLQQLVNSLPHPPPKSPTPSTVTHTQPGKR